MGKTGSDATGYCVDMCGVVDIWGIGGDLMIQLEEMTERDEILNPECRFIDHIVWLRRTFLRARANSTGDEFDKICQLQHELDDFLDQQFSKVDQ